MNPNSEAGRSDQQRLGALWRSSNQNSKNAYEANRDHQNAHDDQVLTGPIGEDLDAVLDRKRRARLKRGQCLRALDLLKHDPIWKSQACFAEYGCGSAAPKVDCKATYDEITRAFKLILGYDETVYPNGISMSAETPSSLKHGGLCQKDAYCEKVTTTMKNLLGAFTRARVTHDSLSVLLVLRTATASFSTLVVFKSGKGEFFACVRLDTPDVAGPDFVLMHDATTGDVVVVSLHRLTHQLIENTVADHKSVDVINYEVCELERVRFREFAYTRKAGTVSEGDLHTSVVHAVRRRRRDAEWAPFGIPCTLR